MTAAGIIAEFNPFHLGHKYLIDSVKEKYDIAVCVISGNFVQRGDVSIIDKHARAEMALNSGADLCIELPVAWSMTTAQNFALGGVSLLKNLGNINAIAFGSECGDVSLLCKAADMLSDKTYKFELETQLGMGKTFAAARQAALTFVLGDAADIFSTPNNTLAAEYINAAKQLGFKTDYFTVKRLGANHDDLSPADKTAAGQLLREAIFSGNLNLVQEYTDKKSFEILAREYNAQKIANIENIETAILASLRLANKKVFQTLPDLSEGIENRLISFVKSAKSLNDLYNQIKTKRYTMARIRRLVLSAFLQIDNSFFGKTPPYIKVLGFTDKGEKFLKNTAKSANLPIITRSKDIANLDNFSKAVFNCECRATDIFALSTAAPLPCGMEYTEKILKV